MEHRQLRILVRQNLTKSFNNMYRVKKAICSNLNLEGFAKMHIELLNIPTRDRHNWVANGI